MLSPLRLFPDERFLPEKQTLIFFAVLAASLQMLGFFLFHIEFGNLNSPEPMIAAGKAAEFFITFYVSFFSAVLLSGILAMARHVSIMLVSAFFAAFCFVVATYAMPASMAIRLCLYAGFLILLSVKFAFPLNSILTAAFIAIFTIFQTTRPLGTSFALSNDTAQAGTVQILAQAAILAVVSLLSSLYRGASDRFIDAQKTIEHLDTTINRLSRFNQDLQQYARMIDEEAILKERNRISREIHDISGYMFTNLIALMDAAISMGGRDPERLSELHLAARAQAKEGLVETRKALKALRSSDVGREKGLNAIFKIKKVFEKVTGIQVHIESGNIPLSFGPGIDMALYRLIQEALTNAMRHGRATEVFITFWIQGSMLEVVVRDNGIGSKQIVKGIGLSGMEERLANLGGTLAADSLPEGGFRLTAQIPLPQET